MDLTNKYEILWDQGDFKQETAHIRLLDNRWPDLIYSYGFVTLDESKEEPVLRFSYNIQENPEELDIEDLENDQEFIKLLGDILVDIFEQREQ